MVIVFNERQYNGLYHIKSQRHILDLTLNSLLKATTPFYYQRIRCQWFNGMVSRKGMGTKTILAHSCSEIAA